MSNLTDKQMYFVETFIVSLKNHDETTTQGAVKSAQQARDETGIAAGTVKKRTFLATRWQKIPGEMKAQVDLLRAEMIADVPEENPAQLADSVQASLDAFCEKMQDSLDSAINAGDPGFESSIALIDDFRSWVENDKLIQHIKNNPFDKGADVEPVLLGALDEMKSVLAA